MLKGIHRPRTIQAKPGGVSSVSIQIPPRLRPEACRNAPHKVTAQILLSTIRFRRDRHESTGRAKKRLNNYSRIGKLNGPGLRISIQALTPVIEWRARPIADPVEKLRFLRNTTGGRLPRWRDAVQAQAEPGVGFPLVMLLLPFTDLRRHQHRHPEAHDAAVGPDGGDLIPTLAGGEEIRL